jgi:hypothetical protein
MKSLLSILVVCAALVLSLGSASAQSDDDGWVRVYTTPDASVTIDGKPYPRRAEYGMRVSSNARHQIAVRKGDKEKTYTIVVRKGEMRTMLVDLTGYQTTPKASVTGAAKYTPPKKAEAKDDDATTGKLTVYSKPKGEVFVDGNALGATTPMINREVELGRHEVQVKWESGDMSEVKTIRIRKGSKLKLFFRDRNNKIK